MRGSNWRRSKEEFQWDIQYTHKHTPNEMSMDCRCNAINTIAIGHQIVSATLYLICHAHAYTQFYTHTTIVNGYLAHARPHFGELKFIRWLWTNSIKLLADNRKLIFDSILVVLFFRLPARFRCINIFCLWLYRNVTHKIEMTLLAARSSHIPFSFVTIISNCAVPSSPILNEYQLVNIDFDSRFKEEKKQLIKRKMLQSNAPKTEIISKLPIFTV